MKRKKPFGRCELCGRKTPLTFHHLIPKRAHKKHYIAKHFHQKRLEEGIHICRLCHKGIHKTYDELTLAKHLNTLHALRSDPKLHRHFKWVSRQKEYAPPPRSPNSP